MPALVSRTSARRRATAALVAPALVVLMIAPPTSTHASPSPTGAGAPVAMSDSAFTVTADRYLPRHYVLPGSTFHPEGIARHPRRSVAYVTSASDGTIARLDLRSGAATVFSPAGEGGRKLGAGTKVDVAGRLFVAGGPSGAVQVYDTWTGRLLGTFDTGRTDSFLNDIALAPNGDVYVTDSTAPVLWRLTARELRPPWPSGSPVTGRLESFADLRGVVDYDPANAVEERAAGYNGNGIVVAPDGRTALFADMDSSALHRVDLRTRHVTPVAVDGDAVTSDGLLFSGGHLYAVDSLSAPGNAIVKLALDREWREARVLSRTTRPDLLFPATIAADGHDLLVTNFQYDRMAAGEPPVLPFTITRMPRP